MDLQTKLKDQYVSYRDTLKEKNIVEELKQKISGTKEVEISRANKENTRKWHAKTY